MDETTLSNGSFFVTGPDFDTWSGPDLQLFHDLESTNEEEGILQSPSLHGIVQGSITFERIDLSSLVTVSSQDTTGNGSLYRTKVLFTPTNRLEANVEYHVYLTGDEDDSDSLLTGISARTVFDTVASGVNTGNGTAEFSGGYTGTAAGDFYHITITTAGAVGDSKFTWYRDSQPLNVYGPLKTRRSEIILSDGVTVSFEEGTYDIGDHWLVQVKERVIFDGNLVYPFTTGTGSIITLPDTTSTSIIGDTNLPVATSSSTFTVLSTSPADKATNQTIPDGPFPITINFSADIDPTTVVSGETVSLFIEPVNGDPSIAASGEWTTLDLSVDGQSLDIVVPSGVLRANNSVAVTVDSASLTSTAGVSLSEDYEFWFTTTYTPLHSSVRKLRLEYGAYLANVTADTINLAIFEASLAADLLTFAVTINSSYYDFVRREWVTCKAAELLLTNTLGSNNALRSKRLGDLEVSYNTTLGSDALDRALACQEKWAPILEAGGIDLSKQGPVVSIKGRLDPDRPIIGSTWADSGVPSANSKFRFKGQRRWTSGHTRNWPGLYPGGKKSGRW